MSEPNERCPRNSGASSSSLAGDVTILSQIRRRDVAALRCEILDTGQHDPDYPERGRPSLPSDYGLSADELFDEATRLGWLDWELHARLVNPRLVAA